MSDRSQWVWMPHAGHFICGPQCRFHLNTYVGGHIVSTLGEYLPDAPLRELFAKDRGVQLEGRGDSRLADYMSKIGFEDIGLDRKYETMVFLAKERKDSCCPWEMDSGSDLDFCGYNDSGEAFDGHVAMCVKWAKENECAKPTSS